MTLIHLGSASSGGPPKGQWMLKIQVKKTGTNTSSVISGIDIAER